LPSSTLPPSHTGGNEETGAREAQRPLYSCRRLPVSGHSISLPPRSYLTFPRHP
jgi:hypothetical protein